MNRYILAILIKQVNKPCDTCKLNKEEPNLEWTLGILKGVLCKECLNVSIERINRILEKSKGKKSIGY